jgi:hypothetical protein
MQKSKRRPFSRSSVFSRVFLMGLRRRRAAAGAPATAFAGDRSPTELIDAVRGEQKRSARKNLTRALVVAGFVLGSVSMALSTVGITTCNDERSVCTTTIWYPLSIVKKSEITRNAAGVLDGRYTEWFWHGQIAFDGTYDQGYKDLAWSEWWPNGNTRYAGRYDAGLRDGTEQWWYESGQIEWEGSFLRGHRHGDETWWHESGAIRQTGAFNGGHAVGTFEVFAPDGTRVTTREMGAVVD